MARPRITVEQMERMSPQDRADAVNAAMVRQDELETESHPEFLAHVRQRCVEVAERHGLANA